MQKVKKKYNYTLTILIFCFTININYSQQTKIITNSEYNYDLQKFIKTKKTVLNKVPYLQHGKTEIWIGQTLASVQNYLNGELNGKTVDYLKSTQIGYIGCNGKPVLETIYKNSLKISVKSYWCKDVAGKSISYTNGEAYYDNNGLLNREIKYYDNGKKESSTAENGLCTYWYENGQKSKEFIVKSDIYVGEFNQWFETGILELKGQYKDGYKNGTWINYDENGNIKQRDEYDMGNRIPSEEEVLAEQEKIKLEKKRQIEMEN